MKSRVAFELEGAWVAPEGTPLPDPEKGEAPSSPWESIFPTRTSFELTETIETHDYTNHAPDPLWKKHRDIEIRWLDPDLFVAEKFATEFRGIAAADARLRAIREHEKTRLFLNRAEAIRYIAETQCRGREALKLANCGQRVIHTVEFGPKALTLIGRRENSTGVIVAPSVIFIATLEWQAGYVGPGNRDLAERWELTKFVGRILPGPEDHYLTIHQRRSEPFSFFRKRDSPPRDSLFPYFGGIL